MVKPSTVIGAVIVVVAGVLGYFLLSKTGINPLQKTSQAGQSSLTATTAPNLAGASYITYYAPETFNYNYQETQTNTQVTSTTTITPKVGLLNF